jgi:hypothetical protein
VGPPIVADLGGGVSALVPMALPANDQRRAITRGLIGA